MAHNTYFYETTEIKLEIQCLRFVCACVHNGLGIDKDIAQSLTISI